MLKKPLLTLLLLAGILFTGCRAQDTTKTVSESFPDADGVISYLTQQNEEYIKSGKNSGDISAEKRTDTAENGQKPYAVIVTCSDSRVPAEHIFNAGIGELFVIRTAGNVIGDYELGSVEYGAEHLGSQLVVVLGHTGCGAVDAALNGGAHGYIETITQEISSCLPESCTAEDAVVFNVKNSISNILESEIMQELTKAGSVKVVGAVYDIETGKVTFNP